MTASVQKCDEIVTAIDVIIRPRIDLVSEMMQETGLPFAAAYIKYRFDEIGAKVSVISDVTGHSREHLYYILKGTRPLSDKAASAISQAYPDISRSELAGVVAVAAIEGED